MSSLKQKVSQERLRRLMASHKAVESTAGTASSNKIISPLAKYTDSGQLTCVLCNTVVRSEAVWTIHINTKLHRQKVQEAKELKRKTNNFTLQPPSSGSNKRPSASPGGSQPEKRLRGILKNNHSNSTPPTAVVTGVVPGDFFDIKEQNLTEDTNKKLSISESRIPVNAITNTSENTETDKEKKDIDEALPEGFFDDPILDAKVRNVQYKDPIEEEWEKFRKEMKEETSTSAAIIAGEQEEATAERQIDEIDEQMRNWHKVLDLEKKKEDAKKQKELENIEKMDADDSSNSDEEEFDEFLDWRAKKSFR